MNDLKKTVEKLETENIFSMFCQGTATMGDIAETIYSMQTNTLWSLLIDVSRIILQEREKGHANPNQFPKVKFWREVFSFLELEIGSRTEDETESSEENSECGQGE